MGPGLVGSTGKDRCNPFRGGLSQPKTDRQEGFPRAPVPDFPFHGYHFWRRCFHGFPMSDVSTGTSFSLAFPRVPFLAATFPRIPAKRPLSDLSMSTWKGCTSAGHVSLLLSTEARSGLRRNPFHGCPWVAFPVGPFPRTPSRTAALPKPFPAHPTAHLSTSSWTLSDL